MNIVAQIGYSQMETWAARVYGDAKPIHIEDISSLPEYGWMPVGTVEFCRASMVHQGIREPEPLDYPEALRKWMPYGGHVIHRYDEMPDGWTPDHHQGIHGKPIITKLDESLWRPDTPFWVSPYHRFGPEYRFYVLHGEILGYGRYDDIDDDPTDPLLLDMKAVMDMVNAYQNDGAPVGYGLDVGISDEDGMTKLVEVNDGWALGLYKGTCSQQNYLRLLEARWSEIGNVAESGKSKDQQWSVGSNPTASANLSCQGFLYNWELFCQKNVVFF